MRFIVMLIRSALLFLLLASSAFAQDVVKNDGITSDLHRKNLGKIVFTAKAMPPESLKESDLIQSVQLNETTDLAMKAFMGNSLTNYLHRLAPELAADELGRNGNFQFSFFVDGVLVDKENLHPAWVPAETKNAKTIYSATFINSATPDSRWGAIWYLFLMNGGHQALTAGKHVLKIELRPYLQTSELKVGDPIASGELQLDVTRPTLDEKLSQVQPIQPDSGWQLSTDTFDKEKIRELNRAIAEQLYTEIKSIVVIKNGKLLLEEYFNGADRSTLHNPRSVGKSFASTMMGIAIGHGYIKSENQTLADFYNLRDFANYSPRKETVTLKSLLTMSSGFDANDDEQNSPGNEQKMYPTDNWVKFALGVPMDDKTAVGERWRYFTAGMILLGDIINRSVPGGLEKYADQKLFQPLGITKYEWQFTPQKVPNTAGGLQLRALDFAKYGLLYQNGGTWNGKQIIPRDWVNKTFTRQINRGSGPDDYYGYLFWNNTFNVKGRKLEAFYATGNGGNKIFVFKDQPLVIVVTATAFGKWYMHRQVNSMMDRYILPAVLK